MTEITAVFQGGGVKGIGLVGALARVEQERMRGLEIVGYAGTSAGSIVAALAAAGYPARDPSGKERDIYSILMETEFAEFLDGSGIGLKKLFDFWSKQGLHPGKKLRDWVYRLLEEKGVVTFKDLQQRFGLKVGASEVPRLRVIASDLTYKKEVVFDHIGYAQTVIADAVRMSAGIPLLFEPKQFASSLMVDGGLLSNYPLWAFGEWELPTIGFKLVANDELAPPSAPDSWLSFLTSMVTTVLDAHDKKDERKVGAKSTIHIRTGDVATTDFALARGKKQELYSEGEKAATDFLAKNLTDLLREKVGSEYAAVPRLRAKTPEWTESSIRVQSLRRSVRVDRPDAVIETVEEGVVIADQVDRISRGMVGDSAAVWGDFDFSATLEHGGKQYPMSASPQIAADGRAATVRIGFRGQVLKRGDSLKIVYRYKWPRVVPLDEEYWAFALGYYPQGVERFVAEVVFGEEPTDHRFFELDPRMRPVSIDGPILEPDGDGRSLYRYRADITSEVKQLYLFSWRY